MVALREVQKDVELFFKKNKPKKIINKIESLASLIGKNGSIEFILEISKRLKSQKFRSSIFDLHKLRGVLFEDNETSDLSNLELLSYSYNSNKCIELILKHGRNSNFSYENLNDRSNLWNLLEFIYQLNPIINIKGEKLSIQEIICADSYYFLYKDYSIAAGDLTLYFEYLSSFKEEIKSANLSIISGPLAIFLNQKDIIDNRYSFDDYYTNIIENPDEILYLEKCSISIAEIGEYIKRNSDKSLATIGRYFEEAIWGKTIIKNSGSKHFLIPGDNLVLNSTSFYLFINQMFYNANKDDAKYNRLLDQLTNGLQWENFIFNNFFKNKLKCFIKINPKDPKELGDVVFEVEFNGEKWLFIGDIKLKDIQQSKPRSISYFSSKLYFDFFFGQKGAIWQRLNNYKKFRDLVNHFSNQMGSVKFSDYKEKNIVNFIISPSIYDLDLMAVQLSGKDAPPLQELEKGKHLITLSKEK